MTKISKNNGNTGGKEQFIQTLKNKIKNAKTEEEKQYFITVGKELFFDWDYVG